MTRHPPGARVTYASRTRVGESPISGVVVALVESDEDMHAVLRRDAATHRRRMGAMGSITRCCGTTARYLVWCDDGKYRAPRAATVDGA